ncbi:MAG: squalene/phytoene synthase family protein [Rhodospirillaceae bacterium]|nr:squalene/phytoene synthase family protein [Rhodospirillaceae bacterium]
MAKKGNRIAPRSAPEGAIGESAVEACRRLARRHDFERYLATLFAPRRRRPALWILLAFNAEIARTREIVSEAALGRIRLQWWREAVDTAVADGPVRQHEVAAPLAAALRAGALEPALLHRLIDGRARDLDDAPMADEAALLDYAAQTGGALAEAMALAAGGGPADPETRRAARESARALGTGWALAGILRAAHFHAGGGRQLLPQSALAAGGAGPRDLAERRATAGVRATAEAVAAMARDRLAAAGRTGGPADRLLVLKPVALAWLDRLERAGFDPFGVPDRLAPAHTLALMLAARWFGRGL